MDDINRHGKKAEMMKIDKEDQDARSTRVRRLMALTRTARIFQQYTNGFMQELHRLIEIDTLMPKANDGLGLGDLRKKGEMMP